MVIKTPAPTQLALRHTSRLVAAYIGVIAATLVALAVMSRLGSPAATSEAWGHAVIVGLFAVVLPLRLRAARRGSGRAALRAVGVIAVVLMLVNVVEAVIPGVFPVWMRVEMVGIAVLDAAIAATALRGKIAE